MITKEKISAGLKERIVTLEVDPNMGSGTVCRIGAGGFISAANSGGNEPG